jgi:hypothetical protein
MTTSILKATLMCILIASAFHSSAQILNIEDPTLTKDSLSKHDLKYGFGANFNLSQQNETVYEIDGLLESVYHYNDKHQVLLNGQYFNTGIVGTELINGGFIHLRYTPFFLNKLAPQVFLQHQLDRGRGLVQRQLVGGNLRWQALKKDKISVQLATGIFYENEIWNLSGSPESTEGQLRHGIMKSNNMLRLYLQIGKKTELSVVNYYQIPLAHANGAMRLASNVSLSTEISERFQLQINFISMFDTRPLIAIDKFYYTFSNGFGYENK